VDVAAPNPDPEASAVTAVGKDEGAQFPNINEAGARISEIE
jgi:hypothetical protein